MFRITFADVGQMDLLMEIISNAPSRERQYLFGDVERALAIKEAAKAAKEADPLAAEILIESAECEWLKARVEQQPWSIAHDNIVDMVGRVRRAEKVTVQAVPKDAAAA